MNSSVSATISAALNNSYIDNLFANPIVKHLLSPAIVFSVVLWVAYKLFDLGGIKQKFGQSLVDVKDLKKDMKKMTSHMTVIKTHLVTKAGLDAGLFASASPLKLLPKGLELLDKSGFRKIYTDNKDWFIEEVKKYSPTTISDVDEACFKVMENCKENEKFTNFKELAFQNGVSLDVLLRVLAIYLRDELAGEILEKK